jgi:PAS domain S-box-containing protein
VSEIGLWVDPSQRDELRKRLLSEQSLHDVELDFRTKSGSILTCLVAAELIDVGQETCILSVASDITQRKLAEEALRESEERFHNVFRDSGVGMVIVSPKGGFLAANKAFCDCLGYTEEELMAKTVESVTFPEDWPMFSKKLAQGRAFQWFEKRCLHKSGRIVYTESSASVIRSRQGDPQYLVGQVLNITARKEAEETLADMSRKLIAAQEQERARIGRELHDDINQRLGMLASELGKLQDNPSEVISRVKELENRTIEIANDVQALSHELHASKMEYLGAVRGLKSWCREFGQRQGLDIDFTSDVTSVLPFDIGTCFYRVLQEALHNTVKHSGAKRIEVQLRQEATEVSLIIHDSGRGFDVTAAMQGHGLGLTSMKERLRLVNGTITIQSSPRDGTTIHASARLRSGHDPQLAVG